MKLRRIVWIVVVSLVICSCQNKGGGISFKKDYLILELPDDANGKPNNIQYIKKNGEEYILCNSRYDEFISVYNIETNELEENIVLLDKIKAFYFLNNDSILLDIRGDIYLQNNKGEAIDTFPNELPLSLLSKKNNIVNIEYRNIFSSPLWVYNGNIVRCKSVSPYDYFMFEQIDSERQLSDYSLDFLYGFSGIHLIPLDPDSLYTYPEDTSSNNNIEDLISKMKNLPDIIFDEAAVRASYNNRDTTKKIIKSAYIDNRFGVFPKSYIDDFGCAFLALITSYTFNDDMVVISYPYDHNVYVYDSLGAVVEKYECKSKYVKTINRFNSSFAGAAKQLKKWGNLEPRYLSLVYDKYKNLYYRVVSLRRETELDQRTYSIQIIDSNFELLTEVGFEDIGFNPYYIIPTKKGVLIYNQDSENEKELRFNLMVIDDEL